ncbi:HRDC domain-containing protein [Bifidobacterium dolichotidis]|nr:HRDC domain-containing protein [Bifidobacterium dolichotidis]
MAEPKQGVPDVINTARAFEAMCERFAQSSGPVAADAERASGFRYTHSDYLVQFKREDAGIALVDPQAVAADGCDWAEFMQAVGDAEFILHDARQDLPGFADLGIRPASLFDTEMAARLLGLTRFGLASVTERYLGFTLAKEHSAADWSYRPLPRDWRNYAALDVELLIELREAMLTDLKAAGKLEWAREEFQYTLDQGLAPRKEKSQPWLHISHITAIQRDHQALAVAKALWQKRDALASSYDIAPTLLLSDRAIIEAAQKKPHNNREFRAIRSLNERVRIHMGNEQDKMFERYAPIQRMVKPSVWKNTIQEALQLKPSQWPDMGRIAKQDDRSRVEGGQAHAPKQMKIWKTHHPDRFARLQRARSVIHQIGVDTRTPDEIVMKPQIIRDLCWTDEPGQVGVSEFLRSEGARDWQIALCAASLSRVIM